MSVLKICNCNTSMRDYQQNTTLMIIIRMIIVGRDLRWFLQFWHIICLIINCNNWSHDGVGYNIFGVDSYKFKHHHITHPLHFVHFFYPFFARIRSEKSFSSNWRKDINFLIFYLFPFFVSCNIFFHSNKFYFLILSLHFVSPVPLLIHFYWECPLGLQLYDVYDP